MESYSMEKSNEPALTVRGAYKRYSPTSIVLKGLNMNVSQGTIYGLLGPSGCGKTTLLNCIVGRVELDAGEIQTRAKIKADVGYMPQDVALYSTLSIEETFLYYGRLFGLSQKNVQIRTSELISLLELPPEKSVIDNLSGGQQRRVSFAVALLHNPQLLILDEPTVGLDPLLSQSIWEHLVKLTSDRQKTIIITTHYIEEARQAHTVGLMRGGMLLAEESPSQLMLSHNCSTLEQAFLELSHKQCATSGDDDEDSSELETNYPSPINPRPKPHLKSGGWFSWSRFMAQLIKNLFFMWRNKPMMLFLLGLPLVQCTLYNLAIGRDPEGLHIAVVDLELPGGLAQCNNVALTGCNLTMPLSCRYIHEIQQRNLILVEYSDLMSAQQSLRWNKAWAVLHFAHNYSDALLERVTYGRDTSNTSVELSNVDIWMDMSNQYIGNLLKADLLSCYVDFLQGVFRDCGWPPQAANIPIRTEEPVYGLRNPKFIHFASPAVILVFMFYLPMMFTVSVILQEKMAGILERAMVAGVTVLEVIMAHSVVQFVVLVIQTAIMMAVMYRLFDSPFLGSFFWTTNLLLLQGLSGMCFGFLVSVACDSMSTASFMGLGSFFPLCSMSGMLWPQEGMHYFLQTIAWILPMSLSTEAMRALTARGWEVDHPSVYKGFISTSAWIIIFCFATRLVVKFKKGMKGK